MIKDPSYFWTATIGLSIGTCLIRGSFIFLSSRVKISSRLKEIFAYIPAAVLPALITPMVFNHSGDITLLLGKERLFVLILATIVCYKSRSMLLTVIFGLFLLYGIKLIL